MKAAADAIKSVSIEMTATGRNLAEAAPRLSTLYADVIAAVGRVDGIEDRVLTSHWPLVGR
jgi:hypothetical protein